MIRPSFTDLQIGEEESTATIAWEAVQFTGGAPAISYTLQSSLAADIITSWTTIASGLTTFSLVYIFLCRKYLFLITIS